MKLLKILALVMAICLLGSMFIACETEEETEETESTATIFVVYLKIRDGSEVKYDRSPVFCDGTLANAIESFCAGENYEGVIFDENTGMLSTIVDLTAADGKSWIAYYEDEGRNKAFPSIKDATVEAGRTIVLVLE